MNCWSLVPKSGLLGACLILFLASCASEPQQELVGVAEVYAIVDQDLESAVHYNLRLDDGEAVGLDIIGAPQLATGDRVRVVGVFVNERFAVDEIEMLRNDDDLGVVSAALTGQGVKDSFRVAALLVHWGNQNSLTRDEMHRRIFTNSNSTSEFYRENSYGQSELTGDTYGWLRISGPGSGCNTDTIGSRARAAARDAGIDIDAYDQIMYYFPGGAGCSWSGLAYIGRPHSPARDSFYNGSASCGLLVHELGHNYGMQHARSYTCGGGPISQSCSFVEYGDLYDPMGGGCYHFQAYQKAAQGWYGRCNVVTVNGDGVFDIAPTQIASDDIQALRIRMSGSLCPPNLGSSCYYTVEYRQPIGVMEGNNPSSRNIYNGVLIHSVAAADYSGNSSPKYTYLLDMNGNSSTFSDAPLEFGDTFTDPNGIKIRAISGTGESARVQVTIPGGGSGGALCIDGTPWNGEPPPTDNEAPAVQMESPEDGALRAPSSTFDLVATASDNQALSRVELLWTNGGSEFTAECETASDPFTCTRDGDRYSFGVRVGAEGERTWTIRATDTSGNATTSETRRIVVGSTPPPPPPPPPPGDDIAPVVVMVSPGAGDTRPPNSTFDVVADVTDETQLDTVELLWTNGGSSWTVDCGNAADPFTCSQSGNRFSFGVRVGGEGSRTWTIRATDTAGNVTTSPTRTIVVQDSAPPPPPPPPPPPTDTTKPTVVMVSPGHGDTRPPNTTFPLTADVSDDTALAKVELIWTNGSSSWTANCADPDGSSGTTFFDCSVSGNRHTFDVRVGGAGERTWTIRATDTAGNVTTSPTRSIAVQDSAPPPPPPPPPPTDTTDPTVVMGSPADGATRPANSTFDVSATVADDTSVSTVELIWTKGSSSWTAECGDPDGSSGTNFFTCTRAGDTYTFGVRVGGAANRTWTIRARDAAGNTTTSATRTVVVQ